MKLYHRRLPLIVLEPSKYKLVYMKIKGATISFNCYCMKGSSGSENSCYYKSMVIFFSLLVSLIISTYKSFHFVEGSEGGYFVLLHVWVLNFDFIRVLNNTSKVVASFSACLHNAHFS